MTTICVPVCVRRAEELPGAVDLAARVGDVVELRLDYLDEPGAAMPVVHELTRIAVPIIVTMRAPEQGGAGSHTYEERRRFWSRAKDLPKVLFDMESDLVTQSEEFSMNWNRVICSHHDFAGVPPDIDHLYEHIAATPAKITKIAVQAKDAIDCIPIFRLLERAQREGRELIAIAMGQAGIMTRILGPSRGSFLTYASFGEDSKTAPGQLTAKDLRELYRVDQIDLETQIFGIIGNPVGHSLSPRIHNAAFGASRLNAVYIPIQVDDARQFMRRMAHPKSRELDWNLRGLSVTAPHKTTAMSFLDWIDPSAKEIGAVNTIVVRDEQLLGYNTDAAGFISPLREKCGSLNGVTCAVIGAGGAARAILWALRNEGANITLFARNAEKASELSNQNHVSCESLENARFESFNVVINATPLGTRGEHEDQTAATADQLRGVRLAYDLVYNPTETRFLREAREAGCETLSGIDMLLAQAVEQFKLWTGSEPDRETMRHEVMRALR
jgi:3-dehydroquinate dehydratase / shikimate dehydrogenase